MSSGRWLRSLLLVSLLGLGWLTTGLGDTFADDEGAMSLHVAGGQLINGVGRPVQLSGVNRSGTESACINGTGIFDGPNDEPSVRAIALWHANVVRVPLNEDCWLGINGVPDAYSGESYRTAIIDYVRLLHRYGQFVELSLVRAAPGNEQATSQLPMPDSDHAPSFWRSVATTFRDDPALFFGLYGEPHDITWRCWRDGGLSCPTPYGAAGMQSLVDAVRSAGARQPIALSGIDWANNLGSWLDYRPHDPRNALIAELHVYNFNACKDLNCWRTTVLPVARKAPVVTSEVGEDDCRGSFLDAYLPFARQNGISFMAWAWNAWKPCTALITDYGGVPTAYGFVYREHLSQPAATAGRQDTVAEVAKPRSGGGLLPIQIAAGGVVVVGLALLLVFVLRRRALARR
jgi:endoglucanase